MQLSRNISYKSFLLYVFAFSIILMNFSLYILQPPKSWDLFHQLEQRASGFHQTWVTYTEVLLIVHHA